MDKNPTKTREKLRKQRKTPCFLNKNTVFNWQMTIILLQNQNSDFAVNPLCCIGGSFFD
jgi:hypothetical protein